MLPAMTRSDASDPNLSPTSLRPRTATAVDAFADRFLLASAALDPLKATKSGLSGYDAAMPDLSPDGLNAEAELLRATRADLAGLTPVDDVDKVTIAAMDERIGVALEAHEHGERLRELNNIESPAQNLRDVFDLMATSTEDDWATVATRLNGIPGAVEGYLASLRLAASRGDVAAARQVRAGVVQAERNLGPNGFFATFVAGATAGNNSVPEALRADIERGSQAAQAGYRELRDFLAEELLPQAPDRDAAGRDRYRIASRQFLGTTIDLEETYEWGQQELNRITGLMRETASEIKAGASVDEAIAFVNGDPTRKLDGTQALRAWMQDASDSALAALSGTHFDIPEPVRRLECRIAPTTTGVIYYTRPSDDFSRPGRMWWSVPQGVTQFSTWRELTTVYHEGTPGHHLQMGQTVYRRELLNSWRRLGCWVSGHGEGWALYAEWLMAELGFMDDPANRLGLLDGQSMRSARVVLDIGVHCGLPAPAEVGGGDWTYDKALAFLTAHTRMSPEVVRFEVERYLGWPGQAPAYKLGEAHWLRLREQVQTREGSDFNLKDFHRRALDIGSVGLDVLSQALLGEL